jgi:hypothetical protein
MRRMPFVAGLMGLCLLPALGTAQDRPARDPAPDRVSLVAAVGLLEPAGRLGDVTDRGLLLSAGGFLRLTELTDHLAPEFSFQYGFLHVPPRPGIRGASLDTLRILGGLRAFVLPQRYPLRPWAGILAGWAHYRISPRRVPLTPVIAPRRNDRDDVLLSTGGGLDWRLHPNLEAGFQARYDVSFTTKSDFGERDLESVSLLGSIVFNF